MCIHIYTYICIYTVSPRPKSTVLLTTVTKRSVKNAKCVPGLTLPTLPLPYTVKVSFALRSSLSDNRAVRTFKPETHCICMYIYIFFYIYMYM